MNTIERVEALEREQSDTVRVLAEHGRALDAIAKRQVEHTQLLQRIEVQLTGVEKELGGLRQDVKALLNGRQDMGSDQRAPATIPDLSELDDDAQTVYRKLVEVARKRTTITYSETGVLIQKKPFELVDVLDPIFKHEHKAGRPLISSLVVSAVPDSGMPSTGFFAAARSVGMSVGGDERAFWELCRDEVYEYWAR